MVKKTLLYSVLFLFLTSCGGAFKPKKVDTRKVPIKAEDRARKNINEGRGTSLGDLVGRGRGLLHMNSAHLIRCGVPLWKF